MAYSQHEVRQILKQENVRFLRLQFTDIMGINKNIELPTSQFDKALDGEVMFDGSSVQGFTRIEESDMLLKPDFNTFLIFPTLVEGEERGRVARLICDVALADDRPFLGDPRQVLKKQVEQVRNLGFDDLYVGSEPEFFLFWRDHDGRPTTNTNDTAGYFDLAPVEQGRRSTPRHGQRARRDGFRDRGGAPRKCTGSARDRLQVRRRANNSGQHCDV